MPPRRGQECTHGWLGDTSSSILGQQINLLLWHMPGEFLLYTAVALLLK